MAVKLEQFCRKEDLCVVKSGFHQANYDHDNDQFRVKTKRLP